MRAQNHFPCICPYRFSYQIGGKAFLFSSSKKWLAEAIHQHLLQRFLIRNGRLLLPEFNINICFDKDIPQIAGNANVCDASIRQLKLDRCYYFGGPCDVHTLFDNKKTPKKILIILPDSFRKRNLLKSYFYLLIRLQLLENRILLLHSSVVAKKGIGIAFLGASGSGKTTTLLSLLRAGFCFVDDDQIALVVAKTLPTAYASSDEMHALADTLAHFPEITFVKKRTPIFRGHRLKRTFFAREFVPPSRIKSKHPLNIMVFLEESRNKYKWAPIKKGEAISLLLKHCYLTVIPKQEFLSTVFKIFTRLVRGMAFYRLNTSQKIESIPEAIRSLGAHAGYSV